MISERQFTYLSAALLGAVASLILWFIYSPGVDAGFFLDDTSSIRDQAVMMSDDPSSISRRFPMRAVGYYTFWMNYQWFGEDPAAFRLVNIAIHWLMSATVFVFCYRLLSTTSSHSRAATLWIAGFAALLFLCHPLQTGAITYIVQRIASLAGLFFMVALVAWLFLRSTKRGSLIKALWALVFIGSTALALNTKQNAFTLFPVILLLEVFVLRGVSWKQLFVGALVGVVVIVLAAFVAPELIAQLDAKTRDAPLISRWDYFSHQWVVLLVYLKKMIWPAPLMLEYGYEIGSFSLTWRIVAGLCHLIIIGWALRISRHFPLIAFGIGFFYITHSVESGLIPIRDLAFEHRNYLPIVGLCLALASALGWLVHKWPSHKNYMVVGYVGLVLALSLVTRDRNVLWSTPEEFLRHDVTHSGESPRALHNLASWYQNDGQYDKALIVMRSLIKANNGSLSLTHTTTYLAVLLNVGLFDEVLDLSEKLLAAAGNNYERAIVLRYMGTAFTGIADDEAAVDSFDEARRTLPLDYESGLSYGYSLIQIGEIDAAFTHIAEMKQRFGDRTKLRMLAKVADNALQASRAKPVEAAPPE